MNESPRSNYLSCIVRLSSIALVCAFVACADDPIAPDNITGVYVLESFNGLPIPTQFDEFTDPFTGDPGTSVVLADTLRFLANGTGRFGETVVEETIDRNGQTETNLRRYSHNFSYTIERDEVHTSSDPPTSSLGSVLNRVRPPRLPLYLSYIVLETVAMPVKGGLLVSYRSGPWVNMFYRRLADD